MIGERYAFHASCGAVGFARLEDLCQGIMVLGMSMNPLVPGEPYEVVEVDSSQNAAKVRYAGSKAAAETQIASGPWRGAYGATGECWLDASDLRGYGDKLS